MRDQLVVELKAVRRLKDTRAVWLLTDLRCTAPPGLLINFNVVLLQHGIQ